MKKFILTLGLILGVRSASAVPFEAEFSMMSGRTISVILDTNSTQYDRRRELRHVIAREMSCYPSLVQLINSNLEVNGDIDPDANMQAKGTFIIQNTLPLSNLNVEFDKRPSNTAWHISFELPNTNLIMHFKVPSAFETDEEYRAFQTEIRSLPSVEDLADRSSKVTIVQDHHDAIQIEPRDVVNVLNIFQSAPGITNIAEFEDMMIGLGLPVIRHFLTSIFFNQP